MNTRHVTIVIDEEIQKLMDEWRMIAKIARKEDLCTDADYYPGFLLSGIKEAIKEVKEAQNKG